MLTRLLAIVLTLATSMPSHAQEAPALRDRLIDRYAIAGSGTVDVVVYGLREEDDVRDRESALAAVKRVGGEPDYVRVVWEGLDWILIDRRHPDARRIGLRVEGEIWQRSYSVDLGADLVDRHQKSVGQFCGPIRSFFVPAVLALIDRDAARGMRFQHEGDLLTVSGRRTSGAESARYTFWMKDMSLARIELGDPGGPRTEYEVLSHHTVPGLGYRWPHIVVGATDGYGFPARRTVTVVSPPSLGLTEAEKSDLRWWKLTPYSLDPATGTVYEAGDVVGGTYGPGAFQPIRGNSQMARAAKDVQSGASSTLIPESRSVTGRSLLVGGVTCLIVALGLVLRRRMSG